MNKIGKYDIVREIGRGATATVYLGNDAFTQRDVAIKVAFPDILKDPVRGKLYTHLFLNEASLVGKLSHPHIVQIFDAVVAEDLCYIVMEYVEGGTLEDYCAPDKLLPVERVVEIIFKCTRALDFANRIGVTRYLKAMRAPFPFGQSGIQLGCLFKCCIIDIIGSRGKVDKQIAALD